MKRLNARELAMVKEFLNPEHGRNITKAAQAAFPHLKERSASETGSKILKQSHVKDYIARKEEKAIEKAIAKNIADKQYLIEEAHEIGQLAKEDGKLQIALNAVDTKAKLNKVYDDKKDGIEGYRNLLQTLIIQGDVHINKQDDDKTIEIDHY